MSFLKIKRARPIKNIVASFVRIKEELEQAIETERNVISETSKLIDAASSESTKKLAQIDNDFAKKEKALRTKKFNKSEKVKSKKKAIDDEATKIIDESGENIKEAMKWLEAIPNPK